jgi:hypothetical protein
MTTNDEMKDKTFWLTIDQDQASYHSLYYRFSLPPFLFEDQSKVSKRVLTLVHRCTEGVFAEYQQVCGPEVQLGSQYQGEKAKTFEKEVEPQTSALSTLMLVLIRYIT